MMYHLEEGHCPRISAIEFKGYLQHKGLILRLLADPTLLLQITEKDVHGYYESVRDESTTGGVSLLDINDDDITWDEEIILAPQQPAVTPVMPTNQQTWPRLPSQQGEEGPITSVLDKAMGNLNVEDKTAPAPWGGEATTKELFPAAKPTRPTDEWQQRQKVCDQENKKNNVFVSQFWNPASSDFDKHRFYDPVMEKFRCPFPNCDKLFSIHQDCEQ